MTRFPWARFGTTRSWWRHLRLADGLVLSVLPLMLLGYLVVSAAVEYQTAGRLDDWWSRTRGVARSFTARTKLLLNTPAAVIKERDFPEPADDPRALNLEVGRDQWRSVMGDPLSGFGVWLDANLESAGRWREVRLRKRGDTSIHWSTPKVSFTLRTDRWDQYRGRRELGYSVRGVISGYVANRMLREADLLAPRSEVVPVFLNRRFYGLFRELELLDESFLRAHGVMPGNLWRGDAAERGELFQGMPRSLFESPALWDRVASNDRPTAPPSRLPRWIRLINGTTLADHRELMAMMDREELGRFLAVMLLAGDPYHMDNLHNQFWYEDPASNTMRPVPWDLRLQPIGSNSLPLNSLLRAVVRDPWVVHSAMVSLNHWLENDRIMRAADSWLTEITNRYQSYLEYEYLRAGVVPPVEDPAEVAAVLRSNADSLAAWVADAAVGYFAGEPVGGHRIVDLVSQGYAPAELKAIVLTGQRPANPAVVIDLDRNGRADPAEPVITPDVSAISDGQWRLELPRPLVLHSGLTTRNLRHLVPDSVFYRLLLKAPGRVAGIEATNPLTAEPARVNLLERDTELGARDSWHVWDMAQRPGRTLRWSGRVVLDSTLVLGPRDSLIVAAGATLELGPEVSLVSHGVVEIRGTESLPVRVGRRDPDWPWGTFVLQGPGASGSRWQYVEFSGGGGATVAGVEYIGMVNIHHAADVVIERATFRDNVRSDDTFHALLSSVILRDSRFINANSDAVDFDIADGVIEGNRFHASGGDAIDLMTSNPRVTNNTIIAAGDKGISVGEASNPLVMNNEVRQSLIGIEIKDGSQPAVAGNTFRLVETPISASRKNWRYGTGGRGIVLGNDLGPASDSLEQDGYSSVTHLSYTSSGIDSTVPAWLPATTPAPVSATRASGRVLAAAEYRELVDQADHGWLPVSGVRRLTLVADGLLIQASPPEALVTLPVEWELSGSGTLVLEVSPRRIEEIALTVSGSGTTPVIGRFPVGPQPGLVALPLPPGSYRDLELAVVSGAPEQETDPVTGLLQLRYGRLELRRWWLIAESEGSQ